MRAVTALFLFASSALLDTACAPAGQSTGGITQATDANTGSDGLAADVTSPSDATSNPTGSNTTTDATNTLQPPTDATTLQPPTDATNTLQPPSDTFQPPGDTLQPPGDTVSPSAGAIGAACDGDDDCAGGERATCLGLPGGYCTLDTCDTAGCPSGSSCWGIGDVGDFCLEDCTGPSDCRTGEGYVCDADDTCWYYEDTPTGGSPVGGPCTADEDCKDAGAFCYPEVFDGANTGFVGGYCMVPDCTANSCPAGAICEAIFSDGGTACLDACGTGNACAAGYACFSPGLCFPSCAESGCPSNYACDAEEDVCVPSCTADSCPVGKVCKQDGTCGAPPCTADSCGVGYECAPSGDCVPDLAGGPGPGPGPTCTNLPPRDCTSNCLTVSAFEPDEGPGYWDYPINGETTANEYRSYANGHLTQLMKWATAMVDCKTAGWAGGNGEPLGLGDMSEANGDIPGTAIGQPGHPEGTHVDGRDMDVAYYQVTTADNKLRPICPNSNNHCTAPPDNLDIWRQAYIIGLAFQSPRTRVIGVDGQVGPLLEQAIDVLCGNGWLSGTPCNGPALAYETTPGSAGWYYFHHHHWHISTHTTLPSAPSLPGTLECLTPGCEPVSAEHHACLQGDGPTITAPRLDWTARPLHLMSKTRLD